MRELSGESRACVICGAHAPVTYGGRAERVGARVSSFLGAFGSGGLESATRERSGLAHAAGFAGVLYLFRYSLTPLAMSQWGAAGAWLVLALSLLAPLALVLAFAAGLSLDRSREKAGALPALFGLVVGWVGTVALIFLLVPPWVRYLKAF